MNKIEKRKRKHRKILLFKKEKGIKDMQQKKSKYLYYL